MLSLHKKCVIASVIIWWRWFPGVSGVALANTLVIEGCEEARESAVPTFLSPETEELVLHFFGLMVAYWTGCFFWRCRSRFDVFLPLFLMACEQTCSLLIVWCQSHVARLFVFKFWIGFSVISVSRLVGYLILRRLMKPICKNNRFFPVNRLTASPYVLMVRKIICC